MKTIEGITLDWIHARVIEEDGCLLWNGACGQNGRLPQARIGTIAMGMRRVVWQLAHERPIPDNRRISMSCGNDKCIHPDHVRARVINSGFKGVKKSHLHKAKIARGRRAGSAWSDADIAAIKASTEPVADIAAANSMDVSYVHYIRQGKARKDFSNPFIQLGAQ